MTPNPTDLLRLRERATELACELEKSASAYDEQVFRPLDEGQVKQLVDVMQFRTPVMYASDRLHAQWARHLHKTNRSLEIVEVLNHAAAIIEGQGKEIALLRKETDRLVRLIALMCDGLDDHWQSLPENAGLVAVAKITKQKYDDTPNVTEVPDGK